MILTCYLKGSGLHLLVGHFQSRVKLIFVSANKSLINLTCLVGDGALCFGVCSRRKFGLTDFPITSKQIALLSRCHFAILIEMDLCILIKLLGFIIQFL